MERIDLASIDDITDFTDEEHIQVKKVNHQFRQESKLKGETREFTIFNDIQCYQKVKRKHAGKHKFRINLTFLDPHPKRDFIVADNWLIIAAISAVFSFLLVYVNWFSQIKLSQTILSIMTVLSLSFCFIAFLIALLKTRDRIVLFSRYGNAPILEFINNNPDSQAFDEFMNNIRDHILQAQAGSRINTTDRLKLELKELRRLKSETVIDDTSYEQAKHKILKNSAFNTE